MQDLLNTDLMKWIILVDIPALGILFWMNWKTRRDLEEIISDISDESSSGVAFVRERLAQHKLDMAQNYVSIPHMKEIEGRLTMHLTRIENKIDQQSRQGDA